MKPNIIEKKLIPALEIVMSSTPHGTFSDPVESALRNLCVALWQDNYEIDDHRKEMP